MIDRRAFLRASLAVACAPMIVRASSLMRLPVKPLVLAPDGRPVGTITPYIGEMPPRGYLFCHGQELPVWRFPELWQIIGSAYGGDGVSTFNLPDLPAWPDERIKYLVKA